jgi:hypothetical protein
MRFLVVIATILVLSNSAFAECRQKDCMPNERVVTDADQVGTYSDGFTILYDNVFEIGTNWFLIFEYSTGNANSTLFLEFENGPSKELKLDSINESKAEDSISFSGSVFSNEIPHKKLYINFSIEDEPSWSVELDIFVNKPPASDLFYLWGGMTVFWVSIGAYVLYISSKFTQLREK